MPEMETTLADAIATLAHEKKYKTLRDILDTMNPADIALLLQDMPKERLSLLFRLIPKDKAAEVFVEMDPDEQELLIRGFSDSELKAVLDELYMDDTVDIIEELPANVVKRVLHQSDPETRALINELLQYPEDSAGSIMTTEFVDLRPDRTAGDAIENIRRTGLDKETINTCYVVDESRRLIGAISIRTLILARQDALLRDIMLKNVISLHTLEDKESVAQKFRRYGFLSMPVVDGEERLVGIVTVDDAIEVIESEATEDIEKMAAILPSEDPYLRTSVIRIWKNRIPWLLFLMISATFTGMIIMRFEAALATQLFLTAFIPMLMDTGGNSGSQSSVTIIRGMALGEIRLVDLPRVIWKEARVAALSGVTLAALNFVRVLVVDRLPLEVAFVVSATLVLTVFTAKLVGCTLPLFASKVGFDPAVMASPLITTIVDAISLLIYFRIASIVLHL